MRRTHDEPMLNNKQGLYARIQKKKQKKNRIWIMYLRLGRHFFSSLLSVYLFTLHIAHALRSHIRRTHDEERCTCKICTTLIALYTDWDSVCVRLLTSLLIYSMQSNYNRHKAEKTKKKLNHQQQNSHIQWYRTRERAREWAKKDPSLHPNKT